MEGLEPSIVATLLVALLIFVMVGVYRWTRSRSPNTQLWGTIFESLSHYVSPQSLLKDPKREMHEEKRHAGDDKDRRGSH